MRCHRHDDRHIGSRGMLKTGRRVLSASTLFNTWRFLASYTGYGPSLGAQVVCRAKPRHWSELERATGAVSMGQRPKAAPDLRLPALVVQRPDLRSYLECHGFPAERLTTSENVQHPGWWSPDGGVLAFSEADPTDSGGERISYGPNFAPAARLISSTPPANS